MNPFDTMPEEERQKHIQYWSVRPHSVTPEQRVVYFHLKAYLKARLLPELDNETHEYTRDRFDRWEKHHSIDYSMKTMEHKVH